MRRCVGKSTAPVTGQSVGQTENAEGVLPSTATETVDDIVLPAAVETAGMAETIDEKAVSGKLGRKKPENMLVALQCFLTARYDFRYNLLTEQTEYRGKEYAIECDCGLLGRAVCRRSLGRRTAWLFRDY